MSIAIVSLLGTLLSSGPPLVAIVDRPPAPPSHPHAPAMPVAPAPPQSSAHLVAPAPPAPPRVSWAHLVAPVAPAPPQMLRAHPVAPAPPSRLHAVSPPVPPRVVWSMSTRGPRLGTQVSPMTAELRGFFGAPTDAGLLVQGVEPGSVAEVAGVKVGDVLVEVDGQRIAQVADVRRALADRHEGDEVEVRVVRKKKRKTLRGTLTEGGPRAFTIPPEAEHRMSPAVREHVERQLEAAREQLREVERRLEHMEHDEPGASTPPRPRDDRKVNKRRNRRKVRSKKTSER